jgi:pimeloyl-ACP methyl ester carboxylesterase
VFPVTSAPQLSERFFTIDGAAAFLAAGDPERAGAPTIPLLHGAGMDHRAWRAQLAALASGGARALAPDFPGHGRSAGSALTRISDLADWTIRLADALGLESLSLAGHSMGALVAIEAATRLGARVAGIALTGAAAEMPVRPALLEAAREDRARAAEMIAGWAFGLAAQADGQAEAGRRLIAASPHGVLAADLQACADYRNGPDAAAQLGCPVLVIAGEKDKMTPARRGRALAEAIRGARHEELPGIGHMLPVEAPERVSELLLSIAQWKGPGTLGRPAQSAQSRTLA